MVFLHSKAKVEVKICNLFKRRQAMTSSLRVEAEIINKIPFSQSGSGFFGTLIGLLSRFAEVSSQTFR